MEAPQKIVLPGEVNPVRNSSRYDSKPSGVLDPAGIILECNPARGRDFKVVHHFTLGADIVRYISNRVRQVQNLISFL